MASRLVLSLPALLLSLALCSIPVFASASGCSTDVAVTERDAKIILTAAPNPGNLNEIETEVYVKPFEGFHGLSLAVNVKYRTNLVSYFPLELEDQCLPQEGEWGKMMLGAEIHGNTNPYRFDLWLKYGHCYKLCEKNSHFTYESFPSLRNLTVYGYGTSHWKRSWPVGSSCISKQITNVSVPTPLTCMNPPLQGTPPRTSATNHPPTTPSPQPSCPSAAYEETNISKTVMVMLRVLVVMALMVTAVVVVMTRIVLRRVWRQGSPSSVTKWKSQPV